MSNKIRNKTMRKRYCLGVTVLLAISFMTASGDIGPMMWDSEGVSVRQGYHIEWQRAAEKTSDGSVVYAWSDTRFGDRDVYAQRVDSNGNILWGNEGVQIVSAPGRQEDPALIPTTNGDFIFIWNDFRNDTEKGDLYAQKVNANGIVQWAPQGYLLSTGDFDSPAVFRIVADTEGGAVVLWNELRNGNEGDIYAIRVTADGTIPPEWPADGLEVKRSSGGQRQLTVDTDGAGGALVGWMDNINPQNTLNNIFIQHVTMDAIVAWDPEGVAVCDTTGHQNSPKLCPDDADGAYIVWEDEREGSDGDLYFHHVLSNGTMAFPEPQGKPLITLAQNQIEPRIVADGSGNAIIIWLDTRNDPLQNDIYAQKVDANGTLLWDAEGMPVCTESGAQENQRQARANADGTGGAVCSWENATTTDIFAQRLDSEGHTLWTAADEGGMPVCQADGLQEKPLIRAFSDYSFLAWADERTGSKGIWYQQLDNTAGTPTLAVDGDTLVWGISGNAENPVLINNNDGKIFIFYQDQRDGTAGAAAFMQIVDGNGNTYLDDGGERICPNPEYTEVKGQEWVDACSDGGTGAIAVWEDHRDSNSASSQIYAQKIDANGSLDWEPAGVYVSEYIRAQNTPQVVEDGGGGVVTAWGEYNIWYLSHVSAARLDNSGTVQWSVEIINTDNDDELKDMASDGAGGAYICYENGSEDFNIGAQWVDGTGNLVWGADGIVVCDTTDHQLNPRVISLGINGAIFLWEDERDGARDLYVQKVDASGTPQFEPNGRVLCDAANDQSSIDWASDGAGNYYIIWEDYRSGVNTDLYIQKMDVNGNFLFDPNGIIFCGAVGDQASPYIIADGLGGSYTVWGDFRQVPSSDIYGVHLDANGNLEDEFVWVEDGNVMNDAYQKQTNPVAVNDGSDGMICIWLDKRASGKEEVVDLYMQRLNGYEVGIAPEGDRETVPFAFKLHTPYPNPFNPEVRFLLEMQKPAFVKVAIYDISGRLVDVVEEGWRQAGIEQISWNANGFASGLYLVQLEAESKTQQQKIVLLK
ncbi:hypothetical protein CEE37_11385 [candidate division LCP-89 bacterium B3_LCP]|uniref:Secretion system C-terminal sorting domain-containing protein n=1 Tax=candidate division LCP-89 bacterium B3_LCP TaxID=2012998 RepID=A0A532UVQ1_UNCL8|nr:MAG: hypothetical protein CEE37_11385 [candidate division LCP-89 bacterium B3_LCP]